KPGLCGLGKSIKQKARHDAGKLAKVMRAVAKVKEPAWTAGVCALLLAAFAALSYLSARSKSATYDETIHIPAAWTHLRYGDFRANPEHPPLWKYFAALPLLLHPLQNPTNDGQWPMILDEPARQWGWAIQT